ncbi:MAG: hypothetical protein ACOC8K_06910 [Gemmatimonadota bacterium]
MSPSTHRIRRWICVGSSLRSRLGILPVILLTGVLVHPAAILSAQERVVEEEVVPRDVREAVVSFLNDPETLLFDGGGRVPGGRTLEGDVGSLEGTFVLAGRIEGDLAVVNGDLVLDAGASVEGDVTVLGGGVSGLTDAEVEGRVTVYAQRLRFARESGELVLVEPGDRADEGFSPGLGFGRSRFTIRAGTNYNRVEGLPVMFGPIVETASSNPLRLDALVVWRTVNGLDFDPGEMGYRVRLEQFLGGRELYSVGASAHSLVVPMEAWTLTDLEASLATFFLHRDYRDYYERDGWSVFASVASRAYPLSLEVEYRDEEHSVVPVGSPWSLTDNEEPWRPQALVAEGRLRTLTGTLAFDTRNDRREPTHGWWIRARSTVGVSGSVAIPGHVTPYAPGPGGTDPPSVSPVASRDVDATFTAGFVDARRYNRVGPTSELLLRTVLGGSLTGDPLPPQYQHAFGGEGSLPGFPVLSVDCGARTAVGGFSLEDGAPREEVFPQYGCDRMALFQAEFRSDLGWTLDLGGGAGEGGAAPRWGSGLELRPRWAAFLNAGRGWSRSLPGDPFTRTDESTQLDVGIGITVRNLGVYLAQPLTGDGRRPNFFVRLDHRF